MQEKKAFFKVGIIIILLGLVSLCGFGIYKIFVEKPDYQWAGIYRAEITTYPDDSRYIQNSIMVSVVEEDGAYKISVSGNMRSGPRNGEGGVSASTYLSGETVVDDITGNGIGFLLQASPEESTSESYVQLIKVNAEQMQFRYATSEEGLEEAEFVALERSKY